MQPHWRLFRNFLDITRLHTLDFCNLISELATETPICYFVNYHLIWNSWTMLTSNRKDSTKDNFCNTTESYEAKFIWGKLLYFYQIFRLLWKFDCSMEWWKNSCSILKSEKSSLNFMVAPWTATTQTNSKYFQYEMKIISSWLYFICTSCKE